MSASQNTWPLGGKLESFGGEASPLRMPPPLDRTLTTVWWKVLMAFLHNRAAESHEIRSECNHQ